MNDEGQLRILLEQSRPPWIDGDIDAIIFVYRTRAPRVPWAEQQVVERG